MHAKLLNSWHVPTGKGRQYRVHSLYKGHLPIADNLVWFRNVHNSEVPLYTINFAFVHRNVQGKQILL